MSDNASLSPSRTFFSSFLSLIIYSPVVKRLTYYITINNVKKFTKLITFIKFLMEKLH